jgi:hypothetical protein
MESEMGKKRWKLRPGRPRSTTAVRNAAGTYTRQPEAVSNEVLAVRRRHAVAAGVLASEALNPLAGYTLGQIKLRGGISERQFSVGEAWAKLVRRHASVMGYLHQGLKSPAAIMVPGMACTEEIDEEDIIAVRRRWSEGYRALMEVCRDHGFAVRDIVYAVCVDDRPISQVSEADVANLRIGLNALGRVI